MEFFKIGRDIPFMRYALIFNAISVATFVLALFFLITRGLHLSVEFTGGTVMEVSYSQPADLTQVRGTVASLGYSDVQVQNFGTARDVLIRLPVQQGKTTAEQSQQVLQALKTATPDVELRRTEFVGPQVGQELAADGLKALAFVVIGIMIYLSMRFEWKYAVAGIIANLHDVVIILGFFAFFQWEFSLSVLAAVLAVLGYSVNESVVIFDRIRENMHKEEAGSFYQIINDSINQVLGRSFITGLSVLFCLTSLFFFGGATLHDFSFALLVGMAVAFFSSVFVASPLLVLQGDHTK